MATLILTAVGTLIGGPIGGVIGALAGQEIDSAIIGGSNIQGPRLSDLSVTTSAYGAAIPRHFGQMRVAGSIIWATDLVEHSQTQGGGKGSTSVTTYSYTSSFAVALSSRELTGVGRIWADGSLLRGAAGDLKVSGSMRFYTGDHNQAPDSLIAANEGVDCPGFRGLAYVVFEDLDLSDYGNRIPAMTFEVFADTIAEGGALSLASLFEGVLDGVSADVPLTGVDGYSCEGSFKDTLAKFQPVFPMNCDADGASLTIAPELLQGAPILLTEATVSASQSDFGGKAGYARKRLPPPQDPPQLLRYYDIDLDYQPGSQRAIGQAAPGKPRTVQLPATLSAANAFQLINQTANTANWGRETLAWRCASLDPAIVPGATVTVPGLPGNWRVDQWEWRSEGVELMLERLAPSTSDTAIATSPGLAPGAADLAVSATALAAYELPWDGNGSSDSVLQYAAVASAGAGWSGATLYVDNGTGTLSAIGASGRMRATMGTVTGVLGVASPLMFDRVSVLTVQLLGADMALNDATGDQLLAGANQALVGNELVQFTSASAQGGGVWQLSGLLRGRGGTEAAISGHAAGEAFVLLDQTPVALSSALVGSDPAAKIAALGAGDTSAVEAPIIAWGRSLRPLSPVQPVAETMADGSLALSWIRRARGAYVWLDGVDVPLQEESEAYLVTFGSVTAPASAWSVTTPALTIDAATVAALAASLPGGGFQVQQQGTYAVSEPLTLYQF